MICELQYAGNNAVPSSTESDLQTTSNAFVRAYKLFGLTVSLSKTKVLAQYTTGAERRPLQITFHDKLIEEVSSFTYLGSILYNSGSLEDEITN